ncbi:hypothetical protein [Nocardia blacklockiae]|uniref:hypothetical protein n=1 Tax=Nocardia blacklockiae TaxID=480036 RepID=UPI00189332EA|nr:hypothetical protein [Nocardia blacklockiae]MBF6174023.1 hypothetical protein [Nocardia blacklockiae]
MTTTTQRHSAPCHSGDGRSCREVDGQLTDALARRILHAEHTVRCGQWLAAVAYLSAGLDDD